MAVATVDPQIVTEPLLLARTRRSIAALGSPSVLQWKWGLTWHCLLRRARGGPARGGAARAPGGASSKRGSKAVAPSASKPVCVCGPSPTPRTKTLRQQARTMQVIHFKHQLDQTILEIFSRVKAWKILKQKVTKLRPLHPDQLKIYFRIFKWTLNSRSKT